MGDYFREMPQRNVALNGNPKEQERMDYMRRTFKYKQLKNAYKELQNEYEKLQEEHSKLQKKYEKLEWDSWKDYRMFAH